MITDFHAHSNNSFDSKEPLINMCESAITKGITHIAFTEHFSLDDYKKSCGFLDYSKYYNEINKARQIYINKLNIALGLELCEPHLSIEDYAAKIKEFNSEFGLDYILGSVHNIGPLGLRDIALQNSYYETYKVYFDELYKMAHYGEFNVAAHLDLMSRYALDIHGDYKFGDFKDELYEILKILVHRGKGIEINTSGLRNSLNNIHPRIEILKLYKELGGEIITIGADAHKACDVGQGCKETMQLIKALGYHYIFTFKECKLEAHKLL